MEEIRYVPNPVWDVLTFSWTSQDFGFWPSLKVMPRDTCKVLLQSNQGGPSKTQRRQLPSRRSFGIAEFQTLTPLNTAPKTAWLPHGLQCAGTAVKTLTLAAIGHEGFISASLRIAFHQETLHISQNKCRKKGSKHKWVLWIFGFWYMATVCGIDHFWFMNSLVC